MSAGIMIALGLLALFGIYMFYSVRKMRNMAAVPESDNILTLTGQNFQSQIQKGLIMVDFWAEWCMPCKVMGPVLNDLADDQNFKATVAKLNVDQFPSISQKHAIRGIPTLILFKDGKEVDRFVGVKSKDFLMKQIVKHQT